ncbi:hypothetical protein IKF23_03045, partial [Candidatus Saccharibacteria bacterium]|nr:hypothetical protein [Candidatus Saccharibacteria bacterium]
IYIYIYRAALTLFLLSIPSLISLSSIVFVSSPAHAESLDYSVIIDPTLNLSLSSSTVSLNLNPVSQAFSSGNLTATVSTNNINGYKLYLTTEDNATSLIRNNDGTPADSLHAVIETLPTSGSHDCSSGCTESNFPTNYWGYKLTPATSTMPDTTKYYPYTPNTLISQSSTTTNSTTATLTLAAKADYEKPAGTYELDLNFKALPKMTSYYMQDFATDPTLKDTICTEEPTMIMDKRDGHTYAIAKLKDGKCWMLQNLRLGENLESVTGSITLTSEDTNISSTDTINPRSEFTLTNKVADGHMPMKEIIDPLFDGAGYIWDAPAFYCTTAYGCYYNFYTSTAGARAEAREGINPDPSVVTTKNTDIPSTICPKGWTMPTGGEQTNLHTSQIVSLANSYGYTESDYGALAAQNLLIKPISSTDNINGYFVPGFILAGDYAIDGAREIGVYARYQSRTIYSMSHLYTLALYGSSTDPVNHTNRYIARSVRCLAQ